MSHLENKYRTETIKDAIKGVRISSMLGIIGFGIYILIFLIVGDIDIF